MNWTKEIPKNPGYYWVKIYDKDAIPEIIYYGSLGIVSQIGKSKSNVSTYYDVRLWSSKSIEPPMEGLENENSIPLHH